MWESYKIACETVWEGIEENKPVPQSYIDKTIPIVERQIVLGGKRLAYVIEQAFSKSTTDSFLQ